MPTWYYFSRPTNLAFHDLREDKTKYLPNYTKSLLGLSLKFCPTPRLTSSLKTINETLDRHERDLILKHYFINNPISDDNYNPRLYVRSKWIPPEYAIKPELRRRYKEFRTEYNHLMYVRKGKSNLLLHHRRALQFLQASKDLIVVPCDKNLGPACIDIPHYILLAYRDHLNDSSTYRLLHPNEVDSVTTRIKYLLEAWLKKWKQQLHKNEIKFIRTAIKDPKADGISTMYLTMKVHKQPLKTRPIVSCSGTLLYFLGIWVDHKLQRVSQMQHSYFKRSTILKQLLVSLELPDNCFLFTADAVSMYTNINTAKAIKNIARYLRTKTELFTDVPVEALVDALRLIMTNNYFRFGDTTWHQLEGTAMGTPPAPPYATLYYAIHEEAFLQEFHNNLFFYRRYIDDIVGVWRQIDRGSDDLTSWEIT